VQNQRLKEVSSLRNQQQILTEALDSNKKKLSSNSEFVAVNGLYKKLKLSLDEIKVMLSELTEMENIRKEQAQLTTESL